MCQGGVNAPKQLRDKKSTGAFLRVHTLGVPEYIPEYENTLGVPEYVPEYESALGVPEYIPEYDLNSQVWCPGIQD